MQSISSPVAGCMRWGKWGANFTTIEYRIMIEACLEAGITSFDHADIYGDYTTEEEFGKALKENRHLRSGIQLITKCGIQMVTANRPSHHIKSYNTSAQHIIQSAERSLKNFGTDFIDVLLVHRPDPLLNPHEVAEAVTALKQQGKILKFGVSNFLPQHVNTLLPFIQVDYNQIEASILHLQPFADGTLDNCIQNSIVPMAWSPLGGGLISDESHPKFQPILNVAKDLSKKYNTGINQILIAFLLLHPSHILPVLGTTKIERLLQAKEATNIHLSREDWFLLWSASTGKEVA